MSDNLIPPHGGELVDLDRRSPTAPPNSRDASRDWPSWDLTDRQICDLELLINGGFSPLTRVPRQGRLRGRVSTTCASPTARCGRCRSCSTSPPRRPQASRAGSKLALRDPEGVMLAVLHVDDVWEADREAEAEMVFGSTQRRASRRRLPPQPDQPLLRRRHASRVCSHRSTTTSDCCAARRPSCARSSPARAGARSWPSRPAIRCTAPTSS